MHLLTYLLMSRYQKGKTNLDFTEARDSVWQWHQLAHMHVCTLLQTDNHTSTPPLSFLQAGCPSCCLTNSVEALKAQIFCVIVIIIIQTIIMLTSLPSVFWHSWASGRVSWPVKIEWSGAGVVISLEWDADCLHMVQLMPLPSQNPIISYLIWIQTVPGKEAVKWV